MSLFLQAKDVVFGYGARIVLDGISLTASAGQRLGLVGENGVGKSTLHLDEPTTHLDDNGMEFLERHLAELSGVVVLSSHDRVFLDAVCTDIVDLDPVASPVGGGTRYGGGYSDYLVQKKAERARWAQRYASEQDEMRELREVVAVSARQVAHNRP